MIGGNVLSALRALPKDLTGKTAIVTGSNVGIGLEVARALAMMGCTVVLACRNRNKAEAARMDIIENSEGKILPEQVEVQTLDLSDLQPVRNFVDAWGTRPLDILINNAGITSGSYVKNPQGFEMTYATNALSHYLLTMLLLPSMNHNARIVNVSSAGNLGVPSQFDTNDLDHSKTLETQHHLQNGSVFPEGLGLKIYGRSKLLQVFMTRELQNRLDGSSKYLSKNITTHVCHPGLVKTAIFNRETGVKVSDDFFQIVESIGILPEQGAAIVIHLAISDEAAKNKGQYWDKMEIHAPNKLVEDEKARAAVWEKMAEHCQLSPTLRL